MTLEELKNELANFTYVSPDEDDEYEATGYELLNDYLNDNGEFDSKTILENKFGPIETLDSQYEQFASADHVTTIVFTMCGLTLRTQVGWNSWGECYHADDNIYEVRQVKVEKIEWQQV